MDHLAPHDVMVVFLALAALLASAKLAGELAKKLGQPLVLGEIVAGILLGRPYWATTNLHYTGFCFRTAVRSLWCLMGLPRSVWCSFC
jgi:Kef-type K+ transport system membrane component KefB